MPKRQRGETGPPATAGDLSFSELLANQDALVDAELAKRVKKKAPRPAPAASADAPPEGEDAIATHRAELAALEAKDPEFYSFLQRTSAGLLGFGADEEGEEEGVEEGAAGGAAAVGGEDEEGGGDDGAFGGGGPPLLTHALASSLIASAFDSSPPSLKGLARAVKALRACVHMGESADVMEALGLGEGEGLSAKGIKRRKAKAKGGAGGHDREGRNVIKAEDIEAKAVVLRYRVTHPAVFMQVVTAVLQRSGPALLHHLSLKKKAAPTAAAFPALTRKSIKALASLWAEPRGENDGLRLVAYLRLRQVAQALPYPTIDAVLKAAYTAFARTVRSVNETSAPGQALMVACLAELFGLDEVTSYAHAFTHLRELAVLLRSALTSNGDEEITGNVLSWQVINCLRAWTAALCSHAPDTSHAMHQLIYPLVQITLGVIRLAPAPRHHPLRLHACAMLVELQWATGVYIPVALHLLDILRCPLLQRKPRGGAAPSNPPVLALLCRVSPSSMETKAYQDALVSRTLELLLDAMRSQFHSPALPELVAPVIIQLKAFARETRVPPWKARAKALVDALLAQASTISAKRAALGASPADRAEIAAFMASEALVLKSARASARSAANAAVLKAAQEKAAAVAAGDAAAAAAAVAMEEEEEGGEDMLEDEGGDMGEGEEAEDDDSEEEDEEGGAQRRRGGKGGRAAAAPTPHPSRKSRKGKRVVKGGAFVVPSMRDEVGDLELDD